MKTLVKVEVVLAAVSFGLIFLAGAARQVALRSGVQPQIADLIGYGGMLLFFCIFGFACIGLMLHVFIALQIGAGNGQAPMIRFLALHETGVTFAAWGFLGVGASIAIPFALYDMGVRLPLGPSRGVLSADIGMTFDEVRRKSTLKMKEPRLMGDGSHMSVEDMVFAFQLGDSPVRFPQSRYYWLETPKNDPHISVANIGITPRKMPKPDIDRFRRAAQEQLFANGWMPGHYVADSEKTVHLWGGSRTSGDGRYWRKGGTLLIFETSRMDEEKPGELAGSGEFIINIALRPKDHDRDLVFEPSAWTP
jgi:hypothetical protein